MLNLVCEKQVTVREAAEASFQCDTRNSALLVSSDKRNETVTDRRETI